MHNAWQKNVLIIWASSFVGGAVTSIVVVGYIGFTNYMSYEQHGSELGKGGSLLIFLFTWSIFVLVAFPIDVLLHLFNRFRRSISVVVGFVVSPLVAMAILENVFSFAMTLVLGFGGAIGNLVMALIFERFNKGFHRSFAPNGASPR